MPDGVVLTRRITAPERGCAVDQPQRLRKTGGLEFTCGPMVFQLLRLVLRTQPRSGRFAIKGSVKMCPY
jgi:hypothetical protein